MTDLSILKISLKRIIKVLELEKANKKTKNKVISPFKKSLTFNSSETPKVSIIVPFYNQLDYTWNCLNFLNINLSDKHPYEIILINDNSSEECDFSLINGITIINNPENLGFLRNVNKGINASKGEYIYLLNNDTEVQKGFLDELFYVFENFPNVGAVGSKLFNADGTLQEAGAIFKTNCDIEIVRKKPFLPEINHIYKVDYCSGCSILFKKHTDNGELNLLDEQFIPAYFEETDLCFNLKHRQKKDIYYTPFSVVLHYDGVSYNSDKDVDPNKISLREECYKNNKEKFRKKWGGEIESIKAQSVEERIAEIYDNKSIILFCDLIQIPGKNSESERFKEIVHSYRELGYKLTLISKKAFVNSSSEKDHIEFYQRLGVNVFYEHRRFYGFERYLKRQKTDIVWFPNPNIYSFYESTVEKYLPNAKVIIETNDSQIT